MAHEPTSFAICGCPSRSGNGVIACSLGNFVFDQDEDKLPGVSDDLMLEAIFKGEPLASMTGICRRLSQEADLFSGQSFGATQDVAR